MEEVAHLFGIYSVGFVLIFMCISFVYHHSIIIEASGSNSVQFRCIRDHYLIYVVVGMFSIRLAIFKLESYVGCVGLCIHFLGPLCHYH